MSKNWHGPTWASTVAAPRKVAPSSAPRAILGPKSSPGSFPAPCRHVVGWDASYDSVGGCLLRIVRRIPSLYLYGVWKGPGDSIWGQKVRLRMALPGGQDGITILEAAPVDETTREQLARTDRDVSTFLGETWFFWKAFFEKKVCFPGLEERSVPPKKRAFPPRQSTDLPEKMSDVRLAFLSQTAGQSTG